MINLNNFYVQVKILVTFELISLIATFSGMIPHKTTRGQQALRRMKAYEDIPARYTSQKTMVVPLAMRMLSLQRGRKFCDVGRLSHEVGWKYQHVVKDYEARRLEREAKRAQRLKIRHVS